MLYRQPKLYIIMRAIELGKIRVTQVILVWKACRGHREKLRLAGLEFMKIVQERLLFNPIAERNSRILGDGITME